MTKQNESTHKETAQKSVRVPTKPTLPARSTTKGSNDPLEEEEEHSVITEASPPSHRGVLPPLLFFPGSSGKVGANMSGLLQHLEQSFQVHVLKPKEEGKGLWAVSSITAERNTGAAVDLIRSVTSPNTPWYLVANSFGNRVAAEVLSGFVSADASGSEESTGTSTSMNAPMQKEGKYITSAELPRALVSLGLPLYAKSKTRSPDERSTHFRKSLPPSDSPFSVLLCSGAKDSCITGAAPEGGARGEELLQEQSQTWACAASTTTHIVIGGSHGVFDGSAKQPEIDRAHAAISSFLAAQR